MQPKTVNQSVTYMAEVMQPEDANPAGNVHGGVIMKHIDNCAGVVAARHARANVVTASIDQIDFHKPCYVGNLLILKGSLNYVGKTSMEVGVRIEAENVITGELRHIASAYLTFVALGLDKKPVPVPPLVPETDDQKRRHAEAARRREERLNDKCKR